MRCFAIFLLAISVGCSSQAQSPADSSPPVGGTTAVSEAPYSSSEKFGSDDLVGISVYDAPQLTGNVRVNSEGDIRLPMLRRHIRAAGLTPDELENAIATALIDEHLMVDPIVSVTVIDHHSRPIIVFGAVRNPTSFQATGSVTLLEAIVKAGGLSENAGSVIEVSRTPALNAAASANLTERIDANSVMDISNPASDLTLNGGETIHVLPAGRVFVVGNVKHPGPLQITDGAETSVLKAVLLSGGLDTFTFHTAYIYRIEAGGHMDKIPIDVKKIMTLRSPDVPLRADDLLYVQNSMSQRATAKALQLTLTVAFGVAGIVLYLTH